MSTMNRAAYKKLIDEDIATLAGEFTIRHPLEAQHIAEVLLQSVELFYPSIERGGMSPNDPLVISSTIDNALAAVGQELEQAMREHAPAFASMHEAHSVILEELEEFWEEVRKKRSERSEPRMRYELTQLAAMAVKAMLQLKRGTV